MSFLPPAIKTTETPLSIMGSETALKGYEDYAVNYTDRRKSEENRERFIHYKELTDRYGWYYVSTGSRYMWMQRVIPKDQFQHWSKETIGGIPPLSELREYSISQMRSIVDRYFKI